MFSSMTGWTVSCGCELSTTKDTLGLSANPSFLCPRAPLTSLSLFSSNSLCFNSKCWCEMLPNTHTLVAVGSAEVTSVKFLRNIQGMDQNPHPHRVITHHSYCSCASYTSQPESSLSWQHSFSSSWMTLHELAPEVQDLVLSGFGKSWHSHHSCPFHSLNWLRVYLHMSR